MILQNRYTLTGDKLNQSYMEITKKYYGHDKGICVVDDEIQSEWSYIPHFYYNFYVYQYATAFTASSALSERVLAGDKSLPLTIPLPAHTAQRRSAIP